MTHVISPNAMNRMVDTPKQKAQIDSPMITALWRGFFVIA